MGNKEKKDDGDMSENFDFDLDHLNEVLTSSELNPLEQVKNAKSTAKPEKRINRNRILFPRRLYLLLEEMSNESNEDIVSWMPHGGGFIIYDRETFESDLLPKYFRQTKMRSFQRQLNIYGFERITNGLYMGGYVNKYFIRGQPHLLDRMERIPIKNENESTSISDQSASGYLYMGLGIGFVSLVCLCVWLVTTDFTSDVIVSVISTSCILKVFHILKQILF